MLYISIFSYLLFIYLNIFALAKFSRKTKRMKESQISSNTSHFYVSWVVLLIINGFIILIQPLVNLGFYNIVTNQVFLDQLATIGFILIILITVILYFYQYKYKKVLNLSHSLGIVLLYVTEYVFITMMTIYFIFS